jgi:hypothetical protein
VDIGKHSALNQPRSWPAAVLAIVLAALSATAWSEFNPEALSPVDAKALRAAEQALFEMVRPGTTELIRPPENDAERYVVKRHKRLVEQMTRAPVVREFADGTVVIDYPDGAGTAVGAAFDDDGQPILQCASPLKMIGLSPHDFPRPAPQACPGRQHRHAGRTACRPVALSFVGASRPSRRPILEAVYTDPPGLRFP